MVDAILIDAQTLFMAAGDRVEESNALNETAVT
jgi:hypothetical protein